MMETEEKSIEFSDPSQYQKTNFYNKFLPFAEDIERESRLAFEEIREALSRVIQLREIRPGFPLWSSKLQQFITLYGYSFTKADHLKLVQLYLSVLTIPDLNFSSAKTCFDILDELLSKTRLITRNDLVIDWRILSAWVKLTLFNSDESYSLIATPNEIDKSLIYCIRSCRPYFSADATKEILDEFSIKLCPFDSSFNDAMCYFDIFLPVHLPPELHHQGYKLWLQDFLSLWETTSSNLTWRKSCVNLFSYAAWYNIGYIDWEPWMSQIFGHVLKNFSLPVGIYKPKVPQNPSIILVATWIVAMIGNSSSCLKYLNELLTSMKSFYHPSNSGDFQGNLVTFLSKLSKLYVDRLHLERREDPSWHFNPLASHRLTEQDTTDFVNCLKEHVFMSIFNKAHMEEAAKACRWLSQLRPQLIVPRLVDLLLSSVESMTEPHRFTSIVTCLAGMTRQIVLQTNEFPQGQTYVIPLLMAVLPGIDSNDYKKTLVTFRFLNSILTLITCVDCSSAVHTRTDLTEIEKEVCLSTAKFEDFISEFLNRTFQMIDCFSTEMSDVVVLSTANDQQDQETGFELTSVVSRIVQQCSDNIFQMIREKVTNFLASSVFSQKINKLVKSILRAVLHGNPKQTVKYFLPQICERIGNLIDQSDSAVLTDHKGDAELTWHLNLFSEILRADGDILLPYKSEILSVFHRCIHIIHKGSYEAVAMAAKNFLKSLVFIYPREFRLNTNNINEPFTDILPIRTWGQSVDPDKLDIKFHIPSEEEVNVTCDFVESFLYPELQLLKDNCGKMTNDERLRSLTMIRFIALGCFRMVERVPSPIIHDLVQSVVPVDSQNRKKYTMFSKKAPLKENLRIRLLDDIGTLLDVLVENHPDDASSIKAALKIFSLVSIFFGNFENYIDEICKEINNSKQNYKNKLLGKRKHPRFIFIRRIGVQIELFSISNHQIINEIDKKVILKLFELSIHRYSEVRRNAQVYLFHTLRRYLFSYQVIVDRIVDLLNNPSEADHDQIKGCLYILLGNDSIFIPTKHSWTLFSKLWPSIARTSHATKMSTQNLIDSIMEKIGQQFDTPAIIEDTNDISIKAAENLWKPLTNEELKSRDQIRQEKNQTNVRLYTELMERLNSFFYGETLTWRQQEMTVAFLWLLLQKEVPIPTSCLKTAIDFLIHDDVEMRKIGEKSMTTFLRLQKPPRIYVERSLEDILQRPVDIDRCQPGDRDDNLWVTIDGYQPPKTQKEWEETCFLDKSFHGYYKWPKLIKYPLNKRERYSPENMPEPAAIIYEKFTNQQFVSIAIQFMVTDEEEEEINFDIHRFRMFKGLFRNFGVVMVDLFLEQCYSLIRDKSEKQQGSHRVAAEIISGMIRGSKHWTIDELQSLWEKLFKFLEEAANNISPETIVYWDSGFKSALEDEDPRRMYWAIQFLHSLTSKPTMDNTLIELSKWTFIQNLFNFEWRIPTIWRSIHQHAIKLVDHPFKAVRERISEVLAASLSFDTEILNGQVSRHPTVADFIESVTDRLKQTIEIYETKSLANIAEERVEIDAEALKALNFVETVTQVFIQMFVAHTQPMKQSIIESFPYFCELDVVVANDAFIKRNLLVARATMASSYFSAKLIESMIKHIEMACKSSKWHARRAAIEFAQTMIFSNLFNARPYAQRMRQLVLRCLFDEQLEVRNVASITLSGFYQCGYISITQDDLKHFGQMSKTSYFTKVDGKKITSTENIVKRHGGVLGLCAIVLSSPYEIPTYVPEALMLLCEHSHDPDLIQKSIKKTLSEFRRTHHDSWHEHREKFTEDQLVILADVLISPSYYA